MAISAVARRVGAAALASVWGCATLPPDPVERALYADVRQVVETRERIGWIIDRTEVEAAAPSVLQSVCQVEERHRIGLLDWLDRRISAEGGPVEVAYRERGEDLAEVEELLTLTRMRSVLEHSDERAAADCPFWMKPDPTFAGVQADTHRFVLLAESFGGLTIMMQSERVLLGGGGVLRLLPSYGFSDRLTMGIGFEAGAIGGVTVSARGTQEISARPTTGIPLLLRVHDETFVYDFELAGITQYHDETLIWPPGLRVAAGFGITSVRIAGIMPVAVGVLAYEYMPAFRDLPATHSLRIGTRIGVDFDP